MIGWNIARLTTTEEFDALAGEWDALLAAARIENIFLTHLWLREWWRVYGAGRELWTLVARDGASIVGIAPLMLERAPAGARRVVFMGAGEIVPNHLDFIACPETCTELTRAFCTYLLEHRAEWDLLELDTLPDDSPTREALVAVLRERGAAQDSAVTAECPYAVLPPSFEEYLLGRGKKTQKDFRYKQRLLRRDFPNAQFKRVETSEELDTVFAALMRLHQAHWTARGEPGAYSKAAFTEFHRAIARAELGKHLRMYYLQIGDEIAAVRHCYQAGTRVFYYSTGFDARWEKYSVGLLVRLYAIEQSIGEGAREADFLQGTESYKSHWATDSRENWRVRAASPQWRGRLAWLQLQVPERTRASVKRVLPAGARPALKRLLGRG